MEIKCFSHMKNGSGFTAISLLKLLNLYKVNPHGHTDHKHTDVYKLSMTDHFYDLHKRRS